MVNDPARGWHGDLLDLDAYLARIGFAGDRAPTIETLRAVQRGHVTTFPFENLEILLGRPILLGVGELQDKLVARRRGGYCYEHVSLFAAVLERLGFAFTALTGRVTMGSDRLRPATHALLLVDLADGGRWICDVGFGGGPLEPVPFADGTEVDQDGWGFRLRRITGASEGVAGVQEWELVQRGAEGWVQRHTFLVVPSFALDYEVGSHFVSTSPHSPFTTRPYVQRFTGGEQHVLDGAALTTTYPDGRTEKRAVGPAELPELLDGTFAITLEPEDARRLVDLARKKLDV